MALPHVSPPEPAVFVRTAGLHLMMAFLLWIAADPPPARGQHVDFLEVPEAELAEVDLELGATNPEAAALFRAAAYASRDGRIAQAESLYARVHALVPGYTRATRNLARMAVQAGHREAALLSNDPKMLKRCASLYKARVPDAWPAEYFQWFVDMRERRFDDAEATLARALALGLAADTHAAMLKATRGGGRSFLRPVLRVGVWILGAWLLAFGGLILVGIALSRAALRSAAAVPSQRTGVAVGLAQTVRRAYTAVLMLSCGFYYASIPIVIALAVTIVGSLIYGFLVIGRIPLQLVALILLLLGATVWATLRSLVVRGRDVDPGDRLDLKGHPRLRQVLQEVADRVGTRVVDNVYLTPGTDLAVMERGGLLRQLRKGTERCLILGVGGLEGMELGPFKALLAHEYGHFSNRDTAGGGLALAVRRSLMTLALGLARGGAAGWYNPVWLFVNGFYRVFLRISQGASRLQEVLADRWAATLYGAQAFERGLRHVIERTVRFGMHAEAVFDEVIEQSRPLSNLYHYRPQRTLDEETARRRIAQVLQANASPYDSHPSPADRFAWVASLGEAQPTTAPDDPQPVWDLFSGREAIEQRMTASVRSTIAARHGVEIPASAA